MFQNITTSYSGSDATIEITIMLLGAFILLYKYGVRSYSDMVEEGATGLEEILESWGAKYKIHNPSTWPDQAQLAHDGKWSELEEYQEILKGWVKKK